MTRLERLVIFAGALLHAHHDVAIHLQETAIAVPREARVADLLRPAISTRVVVSPRLRIVSIMPGMESRAPERTETSSGVVWSPNFLPTDFSTLRERGRRPAPSDSVG